MTRRKCSFSMPSGLVLASNSIALPSRWGEGIEEFGGGGGGGRDGGSSRDKGSGGKKDGSRDRGGFGRDRGRDIGT